VGSDNRQFGVIADDRGNIIVVMTRSHGLKAWLIQRVSAVYMAVYPIYFLLRLTMQAPHGFAEWRGFMTTSSMSAPTLLLFAFLLLHAWVGMRDVVMDYVHSFKWRLTVLSLIAGGLIAMGAWLLVVLVRVS